jgi:membrane-associated protease RseP (regulator of RpoE activity)
MVSPEVYAHSLFSGLVVSQGEQGVKVVEVSPGYPVERAGLRVGDLILEIDGKKIKTLDEFVALSKSSGDKVTETSLLVIRKGKLQNISLIAYSDAVFKEWKEKVPIPPEKNIVGISLFQYYLEKGRAKLEEARIGGSFENQLSKNEEAIKYLFYALHYSPITVEVVILVADTYVNMARLCLESGQTAVAVEDYGKAAGLYEKCSKRHITEKEMELILTRLQEVEGELIKLLPSEEQGVASAEKASITPQPGKVSP